MRYPGQDKEEIYTQPSRRRQERVMVDDYHDHRNCTNSIKTCEAHKKLRKRMSLREQFPSLTIGAARYAYSEAGKLPAARE